METGEGCDAMPDVDYEEKKQKRPQRTREDAERDRLNDMDFRANRLYRAPTRETVRALKPEERKTRSIKGKKVTPSEEITFTNEFTTYSTSLLRVKDSESGKQYINAKFARNRASTPASLRNDEKQVNPERDRMLTGGKRRFFVNNTDERKSAVEFRRDKPKSLAIQRRQLKNMVAKEPNDPLETTLFFLNTEKERSKIEALKDEKSTEAQKLRESLQAQVQTKERRSLDFQNRIAFHNRKPNPKPGSSDTASWTQKLLAAFAAPQEEAADTDTDTDSTATTDAENELAALAAGLLGGLAAAGKRKRKKESVPSQTEGNTEKGGDSEGG